MTFPSQAELYGILDLGYVAPADAPDVAARMLAGGVGILQLRAKGYAPEAILDTARSLARLCREADVPFILNDHPELVAPTGADGVHVGQDDLPVALVREIVGADKFIGLSTHSVAQAVASIETSADYIGFGPLFATPTKPDYTPIGTSEIAEVHRLVQVPIFCIGGIKLENLPDVLDAGARRVVIVSGILHAPDPQAYAGKCLASLKRRT